MRISDGSSDVCSSDLKPVEKGRVFLLAPLSLFSIGPLISRKQATHNAADRDGVVITPEQHTMMREYVYKEKIGRASCRERVCSTGRSRWSTYTYKKI